MKRHILILIFALFVSVSFSQTEEQQSDPKALRQELSTLAQKVESLQKALQECRKNYDSDPKKYGSMIESYESSLFETNQKYSELQKKVASLPQEEQKTETLKSDASYTGTDIIESPFFKSNVSKNDLEILKKSGTVYTQLIGAKENIDKLYSSLQELKTKFDATDSQAEVDSIIISSENLKKDIVKADEEFSSLWTQLYNTKIDNYLVLLDKLDNVSRSELENLDILSREAQSSVDPESTLAPSISDFNAQNKLILAYEKLLAEKLGYTNVLSKVKAQIHQYEGLESLLYPNIQFPYRSTCTYGNITTGNTYSYSTVQEIPQVKIPSAGVYYSVQLYMSQYQPKELSTFKGASPLMQFQSGGYYRYLAGGFRTYADASKNLSAMLKAGFKSPRIIAWFNGSMTTIDKAKANESASNAGAYVIEVKSSKTSTSSLIKDILSLHAEDKNWTSSDSGDSTLYRIMGFSSKEEAGVIAQIILTKDSSLEVNVVEDNN